MDAALERVTEALDAISTPGLAALRSAAEQLPPVAPGLLAWLEHAAGWELDRRGDAHYRLAEPMEAIGPEELGASLELLAAIALAFTGTGHVRAGDTDAIIELLAATRAVLRVPSERDSALD
ncbi:MAG: hypothetical protein ABI886_03170 [Betaproteobacteria bacterium]